MTTHPLGRVAHPVRLHRLLLGYDRAATTDSAALAAQGRAGNTLWALLAADVAGPSCMGAAVW